MLTTAETPARVVDSGTEAGGVRASLMATSAAAWRACASALPGSRASARLTSRSADVGLPCSYAVRAFAIAVRIASARSMSARARASEASRSNTCWHDSIAASKLRDANACSAATMCSLMRPASGLAWSRTAGLGVRRTATGDGVAGACWSRGAVGA